MSRLHASVAALLLLLSSFGAARADTVDARCDIYPKGSDTAAKVVACTFSQRQGHVAIERADGVRHELSPQGAAGRYVDERGAPAFRSKGLGRKGQIYRLARESIYVYWDTAGLPGSVEAKAANAMPATLPAAAAPPAPFDQTLALQGIRFRIGSPNSSSTNELTIVPGGLAIKNTPIVLSVEGRITRAEVADLDADGSPELYVVVRSDGVPGRGTLVAFSANKRKSLSGIHLPPVSDEARAARGYRGGDDFAVVESTLVRRFPVYREGDRDDAPTGGVRQMHYKLEPGEATWRLRLVRVVEF